MPACRQCGKENPGGTTVCIYCTTPIAGDLKASAASEASSVHKVVFTPPPPLKRVAPVQTAPASKPNKGIEWIPWSELSGGQKAGRAIAALLAALVIAYLLRTFLGGAKSPVGTSIAPNSQPTEQPLTAQDRVDGLASICPTLKIYGIPKNDDEALNVARHSEDLFKLPGDRTVEHSTSILTALAHEFQSGSLSMNACPPPPAAAGANQMPSSPPPAK
jgi:hypothetical protein